MGLTAERLHPSERGLRYFEHIKRYRFAASLVKNKIVLDAACGTGYGSAILLKEGASSIAGIDLSEEAILFARKTYPQKNLTFSKMDVTHLSFKRGFFDAVVSFETLEHVPEYYSFLKECLRVLKPGGHLIISTPNRRTFGCGLEQPFVKYHSKEFNLSEFKALIKESGFRIERIYGQRPSLRFSWIYWLRCMVVRFPLLGKSIARSYQNSLRTSSSKPDDYLVSRFMPLFGINISLSDILISEKNLDRAIYFIAVCRKG